MDLNKIKISLTSGCSFSDTEFGDDYKTWPQHLKEQINDVGWSNMGRGGQSNKLIRMTSIHNLQNHLKHYNSDEVLVGIMWSGPDRTAIFINENEKPLEGKVWIDPHNFVSGGFWVPLLLGHMNEHRESRIYYNELHNITSSFVDTLHDILYCQKFFESVGVRYFMSTSWDIFKFDSDTKIDPNIVMGNDQNVFRNPSTSIDMNDDNLSWISELIDWNKFLPVVGMWEWCHWLNPDRDDLVDHHPTQDEHGRFVKDVILPFLRDLE